VKEKKMEERNMEESTTDMVETETETESSADSVAGSSRSIFHTLDDSLDAMGHGTRKLFHDLPGHGVIVGGAVGLGAAMLVGVGELAVAPFPFMSVLFEIFTPSRRTG
jgi:hypothetical protein